MKDFTMSKRKTLHQYIHAWLPTGDKMKQRYEITQQCPHCKQNETNSHFQTCPAKEQYTESFIKTLKASLHRWGTEPTIKELLITKLSQRKQQEPPKPTEYKEWIEQVKTEQTQIGWDKIWKGFLTQSWGDIQENYY